MREEAAENPFMIGAKKSFVPRLGDVLWQSQDDDLFHAYIFKTKDGRKAGFIRIPSYDGGAPEARRFGEIMARFQTETDALVIDQVSNPGGSLFYLYALASHLTDKPLATPRHRLIIGEAEAHQAADQMLLLMRSRAPAKLRGPAQAGPAEEGNEGKGYGGSGYPVTRKFIMGLIRYSRFVLTQFNSGKRFTDPTYEAGVSSIDPAPKAEERYTKPILLLTNALDFSGGDFFPAIMQDNERVTILGVRTSGAGGMVRSFGLPNQFGIDDIHATWSIAERPNGQPIENLGVTPDIPYDITAKDMRTGFSQYRLTVVKALTGLLNGTKPGRGAGPARRRGGPPARRAAYSSRTPVWNTTAKPDASSFDVR
jgi:C-terminal processing protease CtpA/Prc